MTTEQVIQLIGILVPVVVALIENWDNKGRK